MIKVLKLIDFESHHDYDMRQSNSSASLPFAKHSFGDILARKHNLPSIFFFSFFIYSSRYSIGFAINGTEHLFLIELNHYAIVLSINLVAFEICIIIITDFFGSFCDIRMF